MDETKGPVGHGDILTHLFQASKCHHGQQLALPKTVILRSGATEESKFLDVTPQLATLSSQF
jgi:hypothetical protein